MSEHNSSTHSTRTFSSHSSRAGSPDMISWSPSGRNTPRGTPQPIDPCKILQAQVNILFQQLDNTNKTVQNLGARFDQFREEFDQKLDKQAIHFSNIISNQIENLFTRLNLNDNQRNNDTTCRSSSTVIPNAPTCITIAPDSVKTRQDTFIPIEQTVKKLPQTSSVSAALTPVTGKVPSFIGQTKAHSYDGKTSWNDYMVHFETVANLNNWSGKIKAMKLIACMQDDALSTLGDINTHSPPSYEDLISTMSKRFEPKNQMELYRNQMDARVRKKGESLPELVQDIKRLVRLAYPNAQQDVRDSLAYRTFKDALNDRDLAFAICQGNIDTIDEALNLALKYEAFNQSYRKPALRQVLNKDSSVPEQSTNAQSNSFTRIQCSYCSKFGHTSKICRKRLRDSNNQNSNRRWQNSNNFQRQNRERETIPQNQGNL